MELLKGELDATQDYVFRSPDDPIPRDRWSRPLVVPPDGGKPVAYTRCTTLAGTIEDTFNLARWQQRTVAIGLTDRPDLQLAVAAHRDDKKKLNQVCEQAIEAGKGKAAATTGTALHALTERVDRKEELGAIPETYKEDLRAYWRVTRDLDPVEIESFVVQDELKIGGTFDRLVKFRGQHFIADIKTGSISWGVGKIAMQLAVYSRGLRYDHNTATRTPLPGDTSQERAIIIHLPAGTGTCSLHWVDIDAGWYAVNELAAPVRAWRQRKNLSEPIK